MVRVLPVANAMYSDGIADYTENGIGRRWLTPAELTARIALYQNQANELISVLKPATPETSTGKWRYTLI
jgi:hypothetical protein